ncbi:MAG: hypothetical protein QW453_03560 [Thermoprotei archaeon]
MRGKLLILYIVLGSIMIGVAAQGSGALGPELQPSFQATALWGSPQAPLLAAPGSTSLPLYVSVTNLGPSELYSVVMRLQASYPLTPIKGVPSNITTRLPALPVGSTAILVGYFNISPSVQPGVYNQTLIVDYTLGNQTFSQSLNVGVPILGQPRIQLAGFSYNPIRVYPGYPYAELTAVLVNTGTATASSVSVQLNTSYPVYVLYNASSTQAVGYMPVGTPVTLNFLLGVYNTSTAVNTTLTIGVKYNEGQIQSFKIPFNEYPKAALTILSVSTPTVRVGDGADYVTLTVKNTGLAPAQLLTFTLLPSNVFQVSVPSSENPLLAVSAVNVSVGTLIPGQEANVTYIIQVNSNIKHGVYPLSLVATWRQPGSTQPFIQELTVPIQVHRTYLQDFVHAFSDIGSDPVMVLETLLIVVLVVILIAIAARLRTRTK